ncbi:MAG: transcriptional repressor, partial [Oscillospiraceae bacterium]|nr:transcriptional repressor [Oscillospiraceae bacterium]
METTQRYSRKRQAIYDALMRSPEHPSAETIYQTLKPDYPDLSLGT